jgi:hypothetical protein
MVKFFHRNFFPCCFGRSCIVPNLGYVSEAAASFLDRRLGLGIVPVTEIVSISSSAFHYSLIDRLQNRLFGVPLPEKTGSFQLFLDGYVDSTSLNEESIPEEAKKEFKHYFERLVILDYLIRNTDRGSDNWLIKCTHLTSELKSASSTSTLEDPDSSFATRYHTHVAAIGKMMLIIPFTLLNPFRPWTCLSCITSKPNSKLSVWLVGIADCKKFL